MTYTVPVAVPSSSSARTMAACLASVRAQRRVDLMLVDVGAGLSEADWICSIDPDMVLPPDTLAGARGRAARRSVR